MRKKLKGFAVPMLVHNNQARKPTTLVVGRNRLNTFLKVNVLIDFHY